MREILENIRKDYMNTDFWDFTLLGSMKGFKNLMTREEARENEKILNKLEELYQEWEWAANELDSQKWFIENGKTQEERDQAEIHLKEDEIWIDDLATKELVVQNEYKNFICGVIQRIDDDFIDSYYETLNQMFEEGRKLEYGQKVEVESNGQKWEMTFVGK